MKYELLLILKEIKSVNHMIELHSTDTDNINQIMLLQYREMRRNYINKFNSYTKK
jgi:hypothetical protein